MRAAIYARVSTLDQEPENQLQELRRYVEIRGWTAQEYTDHGVSGAKDRRPALDRLVTDAKRRRFDVLVCWRLDRLGRSLKHLITLLADLEALGVSFVSLAEASMPRRPQENSRCISWPPSANLSGAGPSSGSKRASSGPSGKGGRWAARGRSSRGFSWRGWRGCPAGRPPRSWASRDPPSSGTWPKNPAELSLFRSANSQQNGLL